MHKGLGHCYLPSVLADHRALSNHQRAETLHGNNPAQHASQSHSAREPARSVPVMVTPSAKYRVLGLGVAVGPLTVSGKGFRTNGVRFGSAILWTLQPRLNSVASATPRLHAARWWPRLAARRNCCSACKQHWINGSKQSKKDRPQRSLSRRWGCEAFAAAQLISAIVRKRKGKAAHELVRVLDPAVPKGPQHSTAQHSTARSSVYSALCCSDTIGMRRLV